MLSLEEYLSECPPFDWRAFNCCHFVSGWVRRLTGVDHMAKLPAIDGKVGATRLKVMCGGSLLAATTDRLGLAGNSHTARPGDVVLASINGCEALGICSASGFAIFLDENGLMSMPIEPFVTHVWSMSCATRS
jgi:hypothetical protein